MKMKFLLAILSVLAAVAAQTFVKKAAFFQYLEKSWISFIALSLFFYGLAFVLQTVVVRHFDMSKILPASAIAIMILVFLSGIVFFQESIHTKQIIGVLLGALSIFLILS